MKLDKTPDSRFNWAMNKAALSVGIGLAALTPDISRADRPLLAQSTPVIADTAPVKDRVRAYWHQVQDGMGFQAFEIKSAQKIVGSALEGNLVPITFDCPPGYAGRPYTPEDKLPGTVYVTPASVEKNEDGSFRAFVEMPNKPNVAVVSEVVCEEEFGEEGKKGKVFLSAGIMTVRKYVKKKPTISEALQKMEPEKTIEGELNEESARAKPVKSEPTPIVAEPVQLQKVTQNEKVRAAILASVGASVGTEYTQGNLQVAPVDVALGARLSRGGDNALDLTARYAMRLDNTNAQSATNPDYRSNQQVQGHEFGIRIGGASTLHRWTRAQLALIYGGTVSALIRQEKTIPTGGTIPSEVGLSAAADFGVEVAGQLTKRFSLGGQLRGFAGFNYSTSGAVEGGGVSWGTAGGAASVVSKIDL